MTDVPAAYRDAPRWPFGDSPELADERALLSTAVSEVLRPERTVRYQTKAKPSTQKGAGMRTL